MLLTLFASAVIAAIFVQPAEGLYCYRCTSSQPGCGKELSIRLERWHQCPETGPYGGENFCVKVIEKINSDVVITRECLSTLRHSQKHREKLPTVQRHNYCQYGRNNDPNNPYDERLTFCFCNDWNGCNAATTTARPSMSSVIKLLTVCAAVVCLSILALIR